MGYIPETGNLEHFGHKKGLLIKEESLKKPQKTELIRVRGTFLDSLVTKFFSELQEKTSLPTRVKWSLSVCCALYIGELFCLNSITKWRCGCIFLLQI